jgi:hypothetical protein
MSGFAQSSAISYEDHAKTYRARIFGGAAILFAGVALILFSGCFLIGILVLIDRSWESYDGTLALDDSAASLMTVLYVLSGFCFVAGAILVGKGFISLSRTLGERP